MYVFYFERGHKQIQQMHVDVLIHFKTLVFRYTIRLKPCSRFFYLSTWDSFNLHLPLPSWWQKTISSSCMLKLTHNTSQSIIKHRQWRVLRISQQVQLLKTWVSRHLQQLLIVRQDRNGKWILEELRWQRNRLLLTLAVSVQDGFLARNCVGWARYASQVGIGIGNRITKICFRFVYNLFCRLKAERFQLLMANRDLNSNIVWFW